MSEFLFVEKYRPNTLEEVILPEGLKKMFREMVKQKSIPNLLLSGSPGIGKTTIAKAILNDIGADYIFINGSLNGGIDSLRNEILNFASSMSLTGGRKYVILDEGDYLTQNTMAALRSFTEAYSNNCGFIITCNHVNKLFDAVQSRFSIIDFNYSKEDRHFVALEYLKRLTTILDKEEVQYEKKVLVEIIKSHFPDFRKILNQIQKYSVKGIIDTEALAYVSNDEFKKLIAEMKSGNFKLVRKWVAEHSDIDAANIYRMLYDNALTICDPPSAALMCLRIAEYQAKQPFVADHEINTMGCLISIMSDCEFL